MKSNVRIMGHPLHPILVPVAIGAIVAAFIFDIAALSTGNPVWFAMSFWTLLIGVISAVIAALTGIYDYFTLRMSAPARKLANYHFALNVVWLVLLIVSLALKSRYTADAGGGVPYSAIVNTFVLDLIAVGILLVSGWFGGEMVYRHGVAVMEEAAEEVRYPQAARGERAMGTAGGERPPDEL